MPEDLNDYTAGGVDVLFADDLEGSKFEVTELAVYDAEEVRAETGTEVPKFGNWIRAEQDGSECWVVALGELVEELQSYDNPRNVRFNCTQARKTGDKQTDPYEVNLHPVEGDPSQDSL